MEILPKYIHTSEISKICPSGSEQTKTTKGHRQTLKVDILANSILFSMMLYIIYNF